MERLELELINKLNNTVALQKQAYEELDKALKEPSAMMAPYLKNGGIPPASGYKTEDIAQQQQWKTKTRRTNAASIGWNQMLA